MASYVWKTKNQTKPNTPISSYPRTSLTPQRIIATRLIVTNRIALSFFCLFVKSTLSSPPHRVLSHLTILIKKKKINKFHAAITTICAKKTTIKNPRISRMSWRVVSANQTHRRFPARRTAEHKPGGKRQQRTGRIRRATAAKELVRRFKINAFKMMLQPGKMNSKSTSETSEAAIFENLSLPTTAMTWASILITSWWMQRIWTVQTMISTKPRMK